MGAQIIEFPWQLGNPDDPNLETVRKALAMGANPVTDEEYVRNTRVFLEELERLRKSRR